MTDEARTLVDKLPSLLRERPELRYELYRVLSEEYVTRREMAEVLEEIKSLRQQSVERFEQMDRRFEAMQTQMDRRFEAVQDEIKSLRQQSVERFEQMDRRFDEAERRDRDTRDWVGVVVGGFQRRAGRSLEDAVAGTLRVALQMKDLEPERIKLRQKVVDREGLMGPAGRAYEYDIFVTNGRACIFEVKSVPDSEDVDRFADKCELVAKSLGLDDVRKVIVTLAKTPELAHECATRGVELA